jgi:acyl carrier protein
VWQELLGIEGIGIHDDFFELGGHSLLAVQLLGRVHERFQAQLPVQALFEAPTVAGLAARLEQRLAQRTGPELTDLVELLEQLDDQQADSLWRQRRDPDRAEDG